MARVGKRMPVPRVSAPPSDLLWLRRLATLSVPLGAYSFARAYRMVEGNIGHFDLLYQLLCLALLGVVCVSAWFGRWSGFVVSAIVTQAVSGYGALVYFLDRVLPNSMDHSLRHPQFMAWNLLCLGFSTGIIAHLLRKYPMDVRSLEDRTPVPLAVRALRVGLLVAAFAVAADLAPRFVEHIREDGFHSHRCSRVWADSALVLALTVSGVSGMLCRWCRFVSLGLVAPSIVALWTLARLMRSSLRAEEAGRSLDWGAFSQDLLVFAFAVFSLVYLAWVCSPDTSRAELGTHRLP